MQVETVYIGVVPGAFLPGRIPYRTDVGGVYCTTMASAKYQCRINGGARKCFFIEELQNCRCMTREEVHNYLRKKLLAWHNRKSKTIKIIDLLQSNYQAFRYRVANRVDNSKLDFREAIKIATTEELEHLMEVIDEERLGI